VITLTLALLLIPLALGTFSSLISGWQWSIGPPTRLYSLFLLLAVITSGFGAPCMINGMRSDHFRQF
jgi:hypothetical protein